MRFAPPFLVVFVFTTVRLFSQDYYIPPYAGVIDVKRDYGAVGDGKTDDTAAIRAAIAAAVGPDGRYSRVPFIYLPPGEYLVSDSIESRAGTTGWSHGWRSGMILVGANQAKCVIKLTDNCPGFTDPATPRAVVRTGSENGKPDGTGNQAFRHYIMNLTVDTGVGNPGAIGIDYLANNRGCIHNVLVRSGDPAKIGVCGISMKRYGPGPALLKEVTVEGFSTGVSISHQEYSMTFEGLHLRDQLEAGLVNNNNTLAIRGFTSKGKGPVVQNRGEHGLIALLDGDFQGENPEKPAIINRGFIYLRNVKAPGFRNLLTGEKPQTTSIEEKSVQIFANGTTFGKLAQLLPIEETPLLHSSSPEEWCNVEAFRKPEDGNDSGPAIQAAIDSGKPFVCLPRGGYRVNRPIRLRGGLKKLMGFQSSIGKSKEFVGPALFILEAGTTEAVALEHLYMIKDNILIDAPRTLVLRHLDHGGVRNTSKGTGKLFIEDVIGNGYVFEYPIRVWARQLNAEFGEAGLVQNTSGDLWMLGFKTEGALETIHNKKGRVEVLGGQVYPLRKVAPEIPAFGNENGIMTLVVKNTGNDKYATIIESGGRRLGPKELNSWKCLTAFFSSRN